MNKENVRVQGRMVDSWIRKRGDGARMKAGRSERDATRKDDTEDDGTVRGLGKGNFVDATFPAGERRSGLTGHRTERASIRRTEMFSKVTGNGSDHAPRRTCSTEAAK